MDAVTASIVAKSGWWLGWRACWCWPGWALRRWPRRPPAHSSPGRPLGRVRCGRPRPLPRPQDRCRAKPVSVPPPARRRRAAGWRARCGESRTPGSASGLGKRTGGNAGTAPQADSTSASRRTWIQAQSVRDERAQYATGEQTSCQAQVPCLWSALRQRPDVLSITDTLIGVFRRHPAWRVSDPAVPALDVLPRPRGCPWRRRRASGRSPRSSNDPGAGQEVEADHRQPGQRHQPRVRGRAGAEDPGDRARAGRCGARDAPLSAWTDRHSTCSAFSMSQAAPQVLQP